MDQNKDSSGDDSGLGVDTPTTAETNQLNGISSPNNDKSDDSMDTNGNNWDLIDVQKLPKVRRDPTLLSQEMVINKVEEWKGSPVINYKTFRKASQNRSLSSTPEECVRLKRVVNKYNDKSDQKEEETVEDAEVKTEDLDLDFDSERPSKRKLDVEVGTEDELVDKKPRI